MDFLLAATKFITSIFSKNEKVQTFGDNLVDGVINWIEPLFIIQEETLPQKLKDEPENEATQQLLKENLEKLLQDNSFENELKEFIRVGITELLTQLEIQKAIDFMKVNFIKDQQQRTIINFQMQYNMILRREDRGHINEENLRVEKMILSDKILGWLERL